MIFDVFVHQRKGNQEEKTQRFTMNMSRLWNWREREHSLITSE
jgi:hypothetical protein